MFKWLGIIFGTVGATVRCRHDLATENLALGHVPGELIFTRYGQGCAPCENRVTRLCTVVTVLHLQRAPYALQLNKLLTSRIPFSGGRGRKFKSSYPSQFFFIELVSC
jgi:hypothetical protein